MKLLVLAQTPPPLHGQSAMVQALVTGLPSRGIAVRHINLTLSSSIADVGRWRPSKVFTCFRHALRTIAIQRREPADALYYVPAPPGKRGALYRDWVLLALCRRAFPRLILHWHAVGLGAWLDHGATVVERRITRRLLGHATLAIVVADAVRHDAARFQPQQIAVVPNGIPDPGSPAPVAHPPFHAVYLGLCNEEKGLFVAADAVLRANAAADGRPGFRLTAAGAFDSASTEARWRAVENAHPETLRHVGRVNPAQKRDLFASAHALLLPTRYPAEGLPLVALEALAHDRPIIATAWRGLPEIVAPEVGRLVAKPDATAFASALLDLSRHAPDGNACRARYLERFTLDRHLDHMHTTLSAALAQPRCISAAATA